MSENTCIIVCGQKFDIGSKVVLWNEKGGFNAYETKPYVQVTHDRKTGKEIRKTLAKGKRYGSRTAVMKPSFEKLRQIVWQCVLHHTGLYRSRDTFHVLQNDRGLSVQFILDDDGTLYQTLDLMEKAWHAGSCNAMSVGIEIDSRADARNYGYAYDEAHRRKHGVGPRHVVPDIINGISYLGFDYSDAQYATLIRLGRVLTNVFPRIRPDFPRDDCGKILKKAFKDPGHYEGFLCHYHITTSKWDAVSFDYDRFLEGMKANNPNMPSTFRSYSKDSLLLSLNDWLGRQTALKTLGYDVGPVDGICGPKTIASLKKFQAERGIADDGIWGSATQAAMSKALKG